MIKVIATDLDGTLFYPKDKKQMICTPNLFLVQSFIDNGGKVLIASGRSIDYGKKVMQTIGRDVAIIAYNGGVVFADNKIQNSNCIPNSEAKLIINDAYEMFKNFGVFLMTEKGTSAHLRNKSKIVRKACTFYYQHMGVYTEDYLPDEKDFQEELEKGKIFKLMIFFGLGRKQKRHAMEANRIIRNSYENLEASWSDSVVEISPRNCTKANALMQYCESHGYKTDEVAVVGDSGNDISMFKNFYQNSFCMGHAAPAVQKYAHYTLDKFEDLSRYLYKK